MNNENIRKRVNDIYAAMDTLNEKLRELRENCPHTSESIQDYTWGPGRYSKVRVCDFCDEHLGSSEFEIEKEEK